MSAATRDDDPTVIGVFASLVAIIMLSLMLLGINPFTFPTALLTVLIAAPLAVVIQ